MTASARTLIVFCFATIGGLVLSSPGARGQTDPALAKVFADWRKRQERVKVVRYTVSGTEIIPKGSRSEPEGQGGIVRVSPPHDIITPFHLVYLLDLEKNRFRVESSGQGFMQQSQKVGAVVTTTVFNGKSMKTAIPRQANTSSARKPAPLDPDVAIVDGDDPHAKSEMKDAMHGSDWPIFFAHGIVPTVHAPLRADQLRIEPDPEIFQLYGRGRFAQRPCLILRTEAFPSLGSLFDEYWVDPKSDSAIVKYVYFASNKPWYNMEIQYQQSPRGTLPKSWEFTWTVSGQTAQVKRFQVDRIEFDPTISPSDFEVEISPGMVVSKGKDLFRVSADGTWVNVKNGSTITPGGRSRALIWFAVILVVGSILVAGVFLRRRFRRLASS